jgi:tRNA nucleotidyltransferase (CCA-adding enzyme)
MVVPARQAPASNARRSTREDAEMDIPTADQLIGAVSALPAAAPLLPRLALRSGVHLVGGAVRDRLLGGEPYDLDLVVEGDAIAFAHSLGGTVQVHDRFGTCSVTLDGHSYDIASARRERYPAPGSLPEVEPGTLEEDLLRRDFTVNTLAIALGGPRRGQLSSAPLALDDLASRSLRVLHDASFIDDPTRLVRLARYQARLGFSIERHTRELAAQAVSDGALATISGSRLGAELRLLAGEPDPIRGFACLRALSLDAAVHPGFGIDDEELARRALALLDSAGRRDLLALAVAARRVPSRELEALLARLAFEAADRDVVLGAATRADQVARALEDASRPSEIASAVTGASPELVALAGAMGPHEAAREWLERLQAVRLAIDGNDLLAAGVPWGPAVGRGLRAALAAKLDGLASGREAELAEALRAISASG